MTCTPSFIIHILDKKMAQQLFPLLMLLCACISLGAGNYHNQLCSVKQTNEDCMAKAQLGSGGLGGWKKQDPNSLDKYLSETVEDVGKIMKKCDFIDKSTLTTDIQDIYTQVVAGFNICMSVKLRYQKCEENATTPCEQESRTCSILAYKPPSREPLLESNVSIYCQ